MQGPLLVFGQTHVYMHGLALLIVRVALGLLYDAFLITATD
jgi:hypothetical protein